MIISIGINFVITTKSKKCVNKEVKIVIVGEIQVLISVIMIEVLQVVLLFLLQLMIM